MTAQAIFFDNATVCVADVCKSLYLPYLKSFDEAAANLCFVLTKDVGTSVAGLYYKTSAGWRFLVPYAVISGNANGSLKVLVDTKVTATYDAGSIVYKNSAPQTTLASSPDTNGAIWTVITFVGSTSSTGTVTSVGITNPTAGITFSGGPITLSGSFTVALTNDLAAVEGLATTGIVRRTATDTWSAGTAVNLATEVAGNLAMSHLNSGTGATASTFLRGDGTWAAVPGTIPSLVSGLPAAAANKGLRTSVTDSTVALSNTVVGTVVVGGGTNAVPVFSDGTAWLIA